MANRMAASDATISEREARHSKLSTEIAQQGIVLLENNGVLPFDKCIQTIALFGSGARRTIKGGSGSGDVNVRSVVSVEQGLLRAGYTIVTQPWLAAYDAAVDEARAAYDAHIKEISRQGAFAGLMAMMGSPFHAPPSCPLTQEELQGYPAHAAVYVLARNSGEGADRKAEEGDYYLTAQEIADITLLSQHYRHCVLLLNTGGVVELSAIEHLPGLGAIVLISQGGSGGGDAAAAVLSGKVNPSGKLTATWARGYQDYPCANAFGGRYDAVYNEGIYVGYRYFDSFDVAPAYPFGFGRSYTEFHIKTRAVTLTGNAVKMKVSVKNTGGRHAGREIVQVYASVPCGVLDQPRQALSAFAKTKELQQGERETLTLSFSLEQLASYDEARAAWVLERGDYVLRCGSSSRDTHAMAVITILETVTTQQCKNLFRNEKVQEITPPQHAPACDDNGIPRLTADVSKIETRRHSYNTPENSGITAGLTAKEMATLCVGAARINLADTTLVGNFSESIPGAAGETTPLLQQHGLQAITMVDGPAGIRVNPIVYEKDGQYIKNPQEDPIFKYVLPDGQAAVDLSGTVKKYQYCTALPVATMLAQTWNMELLEQAGQLVGAEMEELGVSLWLAPGLNIQRSPLCGRNFEYFSEDPLISGLCAAALTKGVQSLAGKGTTIKHLAANNQETNRNYNNSHVSERALREIYLKGYEICVREAQPLAAMTSVNLLNGVHTANDYDLLTNALRHEWGFAGVVMTDWGTTGVPGSNKGQKYDCACAVGCIKAGNDLIMPGSQRDVDYLLAALESGELELCELQRCAANIIRLLAQVGAKK